MGTLTGLSAAVAAAPLAEAQAPPKTPVAEANRGLGGTLRALN